MKPDESEFKLAYEYFMEAPGGFTYEEFKNLFGEAIQSALAERTEQCAKICNEYTRLGVLRSLDATIKSATAKEIQAKIRALNTETKS